MEYTGTSTLSGGIIISERITVETTLLNLLSLRASGYAAMAPITQVSTVAQTVMMALLTMARSTPPSVMARVKLLHSMSFVRGTSVEDRSVAGLDAVQMASQNGSNCSRHTMPRNRYANPRVKTWLSWFFMFRTPIRACPSLCSSDW